MRHITSEGLALICAFEGFSARAYRCPAGYMTIGYGHLLRAGEAFAEPISEATARAVLAEDVAVAERAVLRWIHVPLADGQFDALVSFTFNVGAGALQRSALRRNVNRAAHHRVPEELMKWTRAGGKIMPGLVRRRAAEAACYGRD